MSTEHNIKVEHTYYFFLKLTGPLIDKIKDKTISKSLILIEKPTINNNLVSTSDLKNLNNILTQ